jgi:hypothetical protein
MLVMLAEGPQPLRHVNVLGRYLTGRFSGVHNWPVLGVHRGLGSSAWWDEAEYKQLGTVNLRALFILDKLIKKDIPKFQAAWAVAFPGRLMCEPSQIRPMRLPGTHGS